MKEKIKLHFSDMWGYDQYQFNTQDNYFTNLLATKYDVVITDDSPDLLIYSVFGQNFKRYDCKKIFFAGENFSKEKNADHHSAANLILSNYFGGEKEVFLPLWVIYINWFNQEQLRPLPCSPTYLVNIDKIQNNRERFISNNRSFCAFITNTYTEQRKNLFEQLSQHKPVTSFGKLFNNTGVPLRGSEKDKIDTLNNFKFNIAFENSYNIGYNTEKIIHPFEVGCIPIYFGGEKVLEYFNIDSFIYANNKIFNSEKEFYQKIFEIDNNPNLWEQTILHKPLKLDNIYRDFSPEIILSKITQIL